MVLVYPMKQFFYIVIGVLLGMLLGFVTSSWLSQIYDYYWATTGILTLKESLVLFAIWGCFIIFGGIAGNLLFHYNLTRHIKDSMKPTR